jgi:transposase, IS5 family
MFTGLKSQNDFSDLFIKEIIPLEHELVKIKNMLNWKEIDKIYKKCFKSRKGNKTKQTEIAIGLIILRRYYRLSYRRVVDELHVNNAYMHFCNVSHYDIIEYNKRGKKIIDHSTLVKILNRLGAKKVEKIEELFRKELIRKNIINGKYVFSDTTSVESNIIYPTEINLLNRVIEHAEKIIQKVIFKKDLIKSETVKKAKEISKIFYSNSKKTKELLNECSSKLLEIAEKSIEKAGKSFDELRDGLLKLGLYSIFEKLNTVGKKIINQVKLRQDGEKVNDKIVSYYEEHARPLPKGKVHKPCEFGMKVRIDQSSNHYITNYKLYEGNPAEATMLKEVIKEHKEIFKEDFKAGAMDRAYFDEELINEIEKDHNILLAIPHKKDRKKKMTQKQKKLYDKRSAIEAKISEGKRMAGLGKCYDKGIDKHYSWVTLSVMILNLRQLVRDMNRNKALTVRFTDN